MNKIKTYSTLSILFFSMVFTSTEKNEEVIAVEILERQGALFYLENEPFSGEAQEYFSNGQLKGIYHYENGERNGVHLGYYENGQISFKREYRRNKKHGNHLGWWPNGNQKFSYQFKNGLSEGESTEWFQSGDLYKVMHYTQGKEDGSQKMWEENGSIRANYVVKDGRRYGLIGLKNCKSVNNEEGFTAVKY